MRSFRAVAGLAVASLVLAGCGSGGSFASDGGDGPCSGSFGYQDFKRARSFDEAVADLEQHMDAPMPAPSPPDWATDFFVAKGTLMVLSEDAAGNKRNVESPHRYGWIRYGVDADNPPSVQIGVREIPYCPLPKSVLNERTVRTDKGNHRVAVLDGVEDGSGVVIVEPRKPWTTIILEWPLATTSKDQRHDDIDTWVADVVEAQD